jgi:uncharacterized iron-regulated protein
MTGLRLALIAACLVAFVGRAGADDAETRMCRLLQASHLSLRAALEQDGATHPLISVVHPQPSAVTRTPSTCAPGDLWRLFDRVSDHLRRGGIVLLGEVHDNPAHHRLRSQLINIGQKPLSALVFEHLRADQDEAIARFRASPPAVDREALGAAFMTAMDWPSSGWPGAASFEPLFRLATRWPFELVAGDAAKGAVRDVARRGLAALPDGEAARLKLDNPLPLPLQDALLAELEASHCGLVPKSEFGNMAIAQRYRDAHLAERLKQAADRHGSAVLFAGNGHLRTDRGVPYYLRQMSAKPVLSIMLIEVEDGKVDAAGYVPRGPDGQPAADYIVFTPRAERKDPCEAMRAQLKPRQ